MSPAETTDISVHVSQGLKARIAGAFYLLTFLTGIPALIAGGRLEVAGDAATTAANILAHPSLFRLGIASYVLNVAVYLTVTALFYEMFKPASRSVSLLAAIFSLVGCAVQAFACVFETAPLVILRGAGYLKVFNIEQVQSISYLALELQEQAYYVGLMFFGFYCLLIGYLIFKSTFLPRVLAGMMVLAGLCWLTFLWPPIATSIAPYNMAIGAAGEASLALWLLIMGANIPKWKQKEESQEWRQH